MTIPTPLRLEEAARIDWDGIVIGAGPAGTVAARELALAGFRVLLVEKKAFPRDKTCGFCLNQRTLSLFDQIGLTQHVRLLPSHPLHRVQVRTQNRVFTRDLPGGVVISRADLDLALLIAARNAGADFLPESHAIVFPKPNTDSSAFRQVEVQSANRKSVTLQSKFVIAADGLGHPSLKRCPEFSDRIRSRSRMGIGTTMRSDAGEFAAHCVSLVVARSGYVGVTRLSDGDLHLAASIDPQAIRRAASPVGAVREIFRETGVSELLGMEANPWHSTPALTRTATAVARDRIFLVGDAAGYVEPFTGQGIAWAVAGGIGLARCLRAAGNFEIAENHWRSWHRQAVQKRQRWCRAIAWASRHPFAVSSALTVLDRVPAVARMLLDHLNQPATQSEWDFA